MSTTTSIHDFVKEKLLGKGSFGSVYLVRRKLDNKIYALKTVTFEKLNKKEQENSVNEVRILASVNHPNVIGYKEAFWDDNGSSLNIVMEYADDGDLQTKILKMKKDGGMFNESLIWSYAIQMIEGLKALHDKKIMHRDIKSANIFLVKDNHQCKIGDMNVSKVIKEKVLRTQTGTPFYASPEVWNDEPYSYKSDLWSIGCVIYELCALSPPFKGKNLDELYVNVCKGKIDRISHVYSDELWNMILMLLQVDVKKRVDCDMFLNSKLICKKIKDMKENNSECKNLEVNKCITNGVLLKTIKFRDLKDIKSQLPTTKYYEVNLGNIKYDSFNKGKENNMNYYNNKSINNNNNNFNNNSNNNNFLFNYSPKYEKFLVGKNDYFSQRYNSNNTNNNNKVNDEPIVQNDNNKSNNYTKIYCINNNNNHAVKHYNKNNNNNKNLFIDKSCKPIESNSAYSSNIHSPNLSINVSKVINGDRTKIYKIIDNKVAMEKLKEEYIKENQHKSQKKDTNNNNKKSYFKKEKEFLYKKVKPKDNQINSNNNNNNKIYHKINHTHIDKKNGQKRPSSSGNRIITKVNSKKNLRNRTNEKVNDLLIDISSNKNKINLNNNNKREKEKGYQERENQRGKSNNNILKERPRSITPLGNYRRLKNSSIINKKGQVIENNKKRNVITVENDNNNNICKKDFWDKKNNSVDKNKRLINPLTSSVTTEVNKTNINNCHLDVSNPNVAIKKCNSFNYKYISSLESKRLPTSTKNSNKNEINLKISEDNKNININNKKDSISINNKYKKYYPINNKNNNNNNNKKSLQEERPLSGTPKKKIIINNNPNYINNNNGSSNGQKKKIVLKYAKYINKNSYVMSIKNNQNKNKNKTKNKSKNKNLNIEITKTSQEKPLKTSINEEKYQNLKPKRVNSFTKNIIDKITNDNRGNKIKKINYRPHSTKGLNHGHSFIERERENKNSNMNINLNNIRYNADITEPEVVFINNINNNDNNKKVFHEPKNTLNVSVNNNINQNTFLQQIKSINITNITNINSNRKNSGNKNNNNINSSQIEAGENGRVINEQFCINNQKFNCPQIYNNFYSINTVNPSNIPIKITNLFSQ